MNCPICGSNNIKLEYQSNEIEILTTNNENVKVHTNVSSCVDCNFIFVSPRESESVYNKFYEAQFRIPDNNDNIKIKKSEFNFIKNSFAITTIDKDFSVFDIGAFDGSLLNLFKNKGCHVTGNDPSPIGVKMAKEKYDIDIINSINLPNDKYDLVTCSNVLEHIYDINKFIIDVKKIISDTGYLYINVPNVDMIARWNNISDFFSFQHLNYFNITTLRNLLTKHGFIIMNNEDYKVWTRVIAYKRKKRNLISEYKQNRNELTEKLRNINSSILIYGAGQHTAECLPYLTNCNIIKLLDSDITKKGKKLNGIDITHISNINNHQFDKILISSYDFQEDMYKKLKEYGIDDSKIIKLYDWFYFN